MKANGRRRWRQWLARERRRRYEPAASWGRDRQRAGLARRHQGQCWAGWYLPSCLYLPASPQPTFSSRSLVGMTQGARKRAARVACMGGNVQHEMPRRIWLMWWRIHRRDGSNPAEPETYQQERTRYRIGQRLRPCPGCCACWGHRISLAHGEPAECAGPITNGKSKRQVRAMRKWQATLADDCDGSGVLPARRVK